MDQDIAINVAKDAQKKRSLKELAVMQSQLNIHDKLYQERDRLIQENERLVAERDQARKIGREWDDILIRVESLLDGFGNENQDLIEVLSDLVKQHKEREKASKAKYDWKKSADAWRAECAYSHMRNTALSSKHDNLLKDYNKLSAVFEKHKKETADAHAKAVRNFDTIKSQGILIDAQVKIINDLRAKKGEWKKKFQALYELILDKEC